jgi:hypothetical protein
MPRAMLLVSNSARRSFDVKVNNVKNEGSKVSADAMSNKLRSWRGYDSSADITLTFASLCKIKQFCENSIGTRIEACS